MGQVKMKLIREAWFYAFNMKCYQKILGICWSHFVTKVRICSRQPLASSVIYKRYTNWLGHVMRLPPTKPSIMLDISWSEKERTTEGEWAPDMDGDLQVVKGRWSTIRILGVDLSIYLWSVLTASSISRWGSCQVIQSCLELKKSCSQNT